MKKKNTKLTSLLTVLLAALGVCLLLVAGIGGARAALTTQSDDFTAEMTTPTIKVELYEKSGQSEKPSFVCDSTDPKAVGTLLKALETIPVGKPYLEELTVKNTGTADAFVRITLYKYWTDSKGKRVDLDPSYITLDLASGDDWVEDTDAATKERTVLYYTKALTTEGETSETSTAVTRITANSKLSTLVKQETQTETVDVTTPDGTTTTTHKTITSTYKYDGLTLNLEVSVDAIQTSNAQTAIKTAWGVDVTANETTLSLN